LTILDAAREGGAVVSAHPFGANREKLSVHHALRFDALAAAFARHIAELKALRRKKNPKILVQSGTVDSRHTHWLANGVARFTLSFN
jgi:hypothetical protein